MAKSMAEGEEEQYGVVYHYLESDFGPNQVQIKFANHSRRLTQWVSEHMHSRAKIGNTQCSAA